MGDTPQIPKEDAEFFLSHEERMSEMSHLMDKFKDDEFLNSKQISGISVMAGRPFEPALVIKYNDKPEEWVKGYKAIKLKLEELTS